MQPEHDNVRYPDPLEARDAHPPATKPARVQREPVRTRREHGRTYPTLNVKVHTYPTAEDCASVRAELDGPADFDLDYLERFQDANPARYSQVYADVCSDGFRFAEERAREIFAPWATPSRVKVYSSGRSGGWLIVEGLPDNPETWGEKLAPGDVCEGCGCELTDSDCAAGACEHCAEPCDKVKLPGLREAWDTFAEDCAASVADIPRAYVWSVCANFAIPEAEEAAELAEAQACEAGARSAVALALQSFEDLATRRVLPGDALALLADALDKARAQWPDSFTSPARPRLEGWTSVSDSLPGLVQDSFTRESVPVLATDGRNVHVAYLRARYDDDDTTTTWIIQGRDAYTFQGVTHWRALPKLPNTAEGAQALA